MRKWVCWALTAVLGVVVLGGCTPSSGGSKSGAMGVADVPQAASTSASAAGAGSAARGAADAGPAGRDPAKSPLLDGGAAKIRTARMTVDVKSAGQVADKANQADDIAFQAGGEVDSDDRTSGPNASASLQLRVPPDQLATVLSALSKLGVERTRESSTTDVTERVADVTSRIASAREAIARLRTLYAGATKVADVIAVESELSGREADLESLQAQQRSLSRQTALATVSLYLETARKQAAPPKHPARRGFLGGLQRGWGGFVAAASWVATAVGTVLPFLVVLLVLGVAARLAGLRVPIWRRRRPTPPVVS